MKFLTNIIQNIRPAMKRFQWPLGMLVIMAVILIYQVHGTTHERLVTFSSLMFGSGAFILTGLIVWTEQWRRHASALWTQVGGMAFWGLVSWWLTFEQILSAAEPLTVTAVLFTVVCWLPFVGQPNDVPSWNYMRRSLGGALVAFITANIAYGGIELLLTALDILFDIKVALNFKVSDMAILCYVLLMPILWFAFLPSRERTIDSETHTFHRALSGIIHFVFVPLLGLYLLILYVYGLRIIMRWELPNGWVTWLTSVSVIAAVLILWFIYPKQFRNDDLPFDRWVRRWLPALCLPLVVMMSIAIGRRISDYGFTPSRIYVLTFNLWCYAACAYLWWHRSSRMGFVFPSVTGLMCLLTIGPQNVKDWVNRSKIAELEEMLTDQSASVPLPLNVETYRQWIASHDSIQQSQMIEHILYLRGEAISDTLLRARLKTLVDTNAESQAIQDRRKYQRYRKPSKIQDLDNEEPTFRTLDYYYAGKELVSIPSGYDLVSRPSYKSTQAIGRDSLQLVVGYVQGHDSDRQTFLFPKSAIYECCDDPNRYFIVSNDSAQLVLSSFSLITDSAITNISGYIFLKH